MPTVTNIIRNQGKDQDRVCVYIDGEFCISIRERTWIGMNISIGSNISCNDLKILERNFWKKLYGKKSWESEKKRIDRVTAWFKKYIPEVEVIVVGFGAGSTQYLEDIHSSEKGEPDLSIRLSGSNLEIIALEVSGTESKRGKDYWVRVDKIKYIKNHSERDIWIVLHYSVPQEEFIWIKIIPDKFYETITKNIKGADEYYNVFTPDSEEIKTSSYFKSYLLSKINK